VRPRFAALLLFALAGCVTTEESLPSGPWQAFRMDTDPAGDRVLLDVALVQAPLGDPFLDQRVWAGADEMLFAHDKRELLKANGYRVGVLVGFPPDELARLLESERTCVDRHGRSAPSGMTVPQVLREAKEPIDVLLQHAGRKETLHLEAPRLSLDLTPKRTVDGRVRVRLTPRVEGSEQVINYKPVPEEAKWTLETKRPGQVLTDLACDVDLLPTQILIVGCRLDHETSAGYRSLVRPDGSEPMQRLVVLRHVPPRRPPSSTDS
jgi:hypothetical protein